MVEWRYREPKKETPYESVQDLAVCKSYLAEAHRLCLKLDPIKLEQCDKALLKEIKQYLTGHIKVRE